jgi:hypothetical protein
MPPVNDNLLGLHPTLSFTSLSDSTVINAFSTRNSHHLGNWSHSSQPVSQSASQPVSQSASQPVSRGGLADPCSRWQLAPPTKLAGEAYKDLTTAKDRDSGLSVHLRAPAKIGGALFVSAGILRLGCCENLRAVVTAKARRAPRDGGFLAWRRVNFRPGKVRAARCQPAWWRSGRRGRCLDKCRRSELRRCSHGRWRWSGNSRRRGSRCRGRALRRARRWRRRR